MMAADLAFHPENSISIVSLGFGPGRVAELCKSQSSGQFSAMAVCSVAPTFQSMCVSVSGTHLSGN
jgi:hypothetical protein